MLRRLGRARVRRSTHLCACPERAGATAGSESRARRFGRHAAGAHWRIVGVPVAPAQRDRGWIAALISLLAVGAVAAALGLSAMSAAVAQDKAEYHPIPADAGPTSTITGLVTDQDGRPVEGVPVFAVLRSDEANPPRHSQRSDAAGRFTSRTLSRMGTGASTRMTRVSRASGIGSACLNCRSTELICRCACGSTPPQSFAGTVVDESGTPVSDVKVTLVREWLSGAGDNNPVQGWIAFDLQTTRTDARGRFRLGRLRPGKIMVMLDHPDFARTLSGILPVEVPEARVIIRKGLTLQGRVVADGKPLPKVAVKVGAPNAAHRSMGQWEADH